MASVHQSPAVGRTFGAHTERAPGNLPVYAAVVLGYLLLLPPQFNLVIAGSVIPPYRFFIAIASLYTIRQVVRGQISFCWADTAIVAAVVWICLAMSVSSPTEVALTGSIAHIADIGFSYFFARTVFRNLNDVRKFLILMLPVLTLTGIIMVIEAVTHTHIIQGIASALTGVPVDYRSSPRMGLLRAQGPFPHPISAGIFLSSFLPLYWLAGFKGWVRGMGIFAAMCSIVTVSSATLLSLVAGLGLLFYNWLTEKIANVTWKLFFIFSGLTTLALQLGTGPGVFGTFIRFASFNTASSYNRVLIWRYGTENVAQNPWFGIGYADWQRPVWMVASIDHYWLLTAIRFGLPASILIAIATLLGILMIIRTSMTSAGHDKTFQRGLAIAMAVFALGLISVSIWLSAQVWYFLLLGLIVSVAKTMAEPTDPAAIAAGNQAPPAGRRHVR